MANEPEWKRIVGVAIAGIRRFENEGHIVWSRESVAKLFEPLGLTDQRVQDLLKTWHRRGAIHLCEGDSEYMTVVDANLLELNT